MSSMQKKKVSKSPKTNTDNSLLSAYVDSPQVNDVSPSSLSPQNAGNRSGEGSTEKRNPHIIDDRQKPITKKNKNRKKREQQRKSLSENQDPEAGNANDSQHSRDDDVIESWEDIQDAGPSDTLPPPPPEFVIDEKAVEERKRKEIQEIEQLSKTMEETEISKTAISSKSQKQQTQGGKKKGPKSAGANKKSELLSSKDGQENHSQNQQKNASIVKSVTAKDIDVLVKPAPPVLCMAECKKKLADLDLVINRLELTFKNTTVPVISTAKQFSGKGGVNAAVENSVNEIDKSKSQNQHNEKSKEEIKEAREAKKKAKQDSKEQSKKKEKSEPIEKEQSELVHNAQTDSKKGEMKNKEDSKPGEAKSKEDIKAEREAKKQAKQAARALAKENVSPDCNNSCSKNEHSTKSTPTSNADSTNEPVNPENVGKSKAELKAERRAKQEAQRAAKANASSQKSQTSEKKAASSASAIAETGGKLSSTKIRVPDDRQVDRASVEKKILKKLASQNIPSRTIAQRKVKLFDHLHQYEREYSISKPFPIVNSHIHPAVLQLGLRYSEGSIQGSNARCLAFMHTVKQLITDFKLKTSSGDSRNDLEGSLRRFSENLGGILDTHITFLKNCRTHSVSMGNAIRLLKAKIKSIGVGTGMKDIQEENQIEERAKQIIFDSIDTFVDHVRLAAVQISDTACSKIKDGDVILTYGCSSLLREVFSVAAKRGRKFKVIVADGRPRFEGREMARHLVQAGIHTTYIFLQSVSYIISEVTKVFLGAHAVFANGCVMSRVGTSQVALLAKSQNVPILVCCETYKFSEKVQTDSFVFNELGDPDDLVATGAKTTALEEWRDLAKLSVLNLSYDVTPASFVDAIISEISVIPTTSVPVVLRLKSMDQSVG